MSEAWYKTRIQKTQARDLLGRHLTLFADKPPKETTFSGMEICFIMDTETSQAFRVMMTTDNIDSACKIVQRGKHFTFVKKQGKKYPEVAEIE